MFDHLILVAGAAERAIVAERLAQANPALVLQQIARVEDFDDLPTTLLQRARLVAFATDIIVPAGVIAALGFGAYNFHPGPPEFPGIAPIQFAVLRDAASFGVTLHAMAARVDSGDIVAVERFAVTPGASVADLQVETYRRLAQLFLSVCVRLARQPTPLPALGIGWGTDRSSRHRCRALCRIDPSLPAGDIIRRVRAFGGGHFGLVPTIRSASPDARCGRRQDGTCAF